MFERNKLTYSDCLGLNPFTPAATVYGDALLLSRLTEAFHTFATQDLDLPKKIHGPMVRDLQRAKKFACSIRVFRKEMTKVPIELFEMIAKRDKDIREWQACNSLDTGIEAYLAELESSYEPDELSDFSPDPESESGDVDEEVEEEDQEDEDQEDEEDMDVSELYMPQEYSHHAGPTHAGHNSKLVPVYCYKHKKDNHRFYTVFQHPYKRATNFVSLNDIIKKTKKLYGVGMYKFIGLLQEVKHRSRPAEGRTIRAPGHSAAWKKDYELVTTSSHV
ncbi:hypothetical protein BDZ88DRAFT_420387 [Geranomyces variabilis]|nr:hypothetical protein BDZ88DRAFT_420387 [Geranomyces variabilis]KAJ3139059.1 hypothetical protein HDU90_000965 [Geranomyces variabilis]